MFTATLYSLVVIVHVAAAALLIGGGVTGSRLRAKMRHAASGQALGMWLDFGRQLSQASPIFGMTLLATGLYMGSTGWWTDQWFAVAFTVWIADVALAVGVVKRSAGALGAALGRTRGQLTEDVIELRDAAMWDMAIAALRANNAAMLYVMFQKPGLPECASVLLLAHAVSFAVYGIGRLRWSRTIPATSGAVGATTAHAA